jgi:4a-hydroxytetrahydrobiopterin dehydratase
MGLGERHATRGKTPRLEAAKVSQLALEVPGWTVSETEGHSELRRRITFKDFKVLMGFVNRVAEVAEAEDHHPDFAIHYAQLDLSLWTHDVGGLTENDFILAAKIDALG